MVKFPSIYGTKLSGLLQVSFLTLNTGFDFEDQFTS